MSYASITSFYSDVVGFIKSVIGLYSCNTCDFGCGVDCRLPSLVGFFRGTVVATTCLLVTHLRMYVVGLSKSTLHRNIKKFQTIKSTLNLPMDMNGSKDVLRADFHDPNCCQFILSA